MNYLLSIHIAGALLTGLIILISWIQIFRHQQNTYSKRLLEILAIFETITGVILTTTTTTSVLHFCTNLFVYLAVIAVTITGLHYQSKKQFAWAPVTQAISLGVVAIATTIALK